MTSPYKTISILADTNRAGVLPVLERVRAKFSSIIELEHIDLAGATDQAIGQAKGELAIVLGGDGTILRIARAFDGHQRPILGINLGKLGYLAEFSPDDIDELVDDIATGQLRVTKRLMLRVVAETGRGKLDSLAVNDIVFQAGPPFRMVELSISINDTQVTMLRGDGLIVSSATGSTGHNLAAGGPVVDPTAHAIVLSPICPHSLTHRPMVLNAEDQVRVVGHRINAGSLIIIDGQVTEELLRATPVYISAAEPRFLLVQNRRYSRWHTLQAKLNWGVGPNYTG